jgi:hypothetical protein
MMFLAASWRGYGLVVLASILSTCVEAQSLQLVSALHPVPGPADGGSGDSLSPVISRDGRYVLFASTANNLVEIRTNTPIPSVSSPPFNVYLRDRVTATTTLVSVNSDGTGGGTCEATAYQEFGYQTTAVCITLGNYRNCGEAHRIKAEFVSVSDACCMVDLLVAAAKQMSNYEQLISKLPVRLKQLGREAERLLRETA